MILMRLATAACIWCGGRSFSDQSAVDAIANPQHILARLDMNIAGAFLHGIIDAVVDQLDDRRVARGLLQVGDILRPWPRSA